MKTLRYADQVFGISNFSQRLWKMGYKERFLSFPTFGMNPALQESPLEDKSASEALREMGIPEQYILCRFDAKSFIRRKNPESVLDVWDLIRDDYPQSIFGDEDC
ncbi:MAG: hypothetical protein WDO06_05540 [Actinomycetota bacterium]